jgi:hypothetical protein
LLRHYLTIKRQSIIINQQQIIKQKRTPQIHTHILPKTLHFSPVCGKNTTELLKNRSNNTNERKNDKTNHPKHVGQAISDI